MFNLSKWLAQFFHFGVAVERALGLYEETFLDAYQSNRDSLASIALENQLADEIIKLKLPVKETPTDLWEKLRIKLDYDASRLPKWFPVNPQQLSGQLRRLAPFLRKRGREVDFTKSGKRLIFINAVEEEKVGEDASHAPDAPESQ